MIKLTLTKYTNANVVEATWSDKVGTKSEQVACVSYCGSQESLLRADVLKYGGSLSAADEELIAEVVAAYVPPAPPTPEELRALMQPLSPWQMRKALRQIGLMPTIKTAIAAAPEEVQEAWDFASEFRRNNELVESFRVSLGKTQEDIDNLFKLGAAL